MLPESFLRELLYRVDIVDLIDGYVRLKKAGSEFVACCPFHSEKSPSFRVSPSKQAYYCFGCGAHGTAIGFLMEYAGLGFVDAVRDLAGRVGLPLPGADAQLAAGAGRARALTQVMAQAMEFYCQQLKQSERAISYLKGRGLSGDIARQFALGYAPAGWQNLAAAFADYASPDLQLAGLVIRNEQGRLYDRFRDRVMFPILSARGEVIAFGGRVLGQGEPKYLNSPETPLFDKGREFFGLPQARQAMRESSAAIIVEGYLDVVALAQHAVPNAVATLGTATTPEHVHKLVRQASRLVFCFDGDAAGRKAAWRALENSLEALTDDKQVCFVLLPEGEDPDSFVRRHGGDAFRSLIAGARPLSAFLLRELAKRCDLASAEGRAKFLAEAKPVLARLASAPLLRLQLVKQIAERSGFSQPEIERLCEIPVAVRAAPAVSPRQAPSLLRAVLRLLLQRPQLAMRLPLDLLPDDAPETVALHSLCAAIGDAAGVPPTLGILLEALRGTEHEAIVQRAAAELMQQPFAEEELDSEFEGAMQRLREGAQKRAFAALQRKVVEHGVNGLSGDEKRQYLQALSGQGRDGRGGKT